MLTLTAVRVDQVNQAGDLLYHAYLSKSTQGVGQLGGQTHHVVFADRHHFNADSVLVVVNVAAGVLRDQLLGVLIPNGDDRLDEFHQFPGSRLGTKEKVQALCIKQQFQENVIIYLVRFHEEPYSP